MRQIFTLNKLFFLVDKEVHEHTLTAVVDQLFKPSKGSSTIMVNEVVLNINNEVFSIETILDKETNVLSSRMTKVDNKPTTITYLGFKVNIHSKEDKNLSLFGKVKQFIQKLFNSPLLQLRHFKK
ncbi:MAG: hypothetical protein M0R77_00325 [Gammaproteobacteria bacterium]|nr:hypothetical protein [Acholeplasmataceae bacterium]MCK9529000.1 hypothetical protein [Gammaproteobacteria bacterium]